MTKPISIPTWAIDTNFTNPPQAGTPTKVDPGAAKQDEGFLPTERPPAQHFNWLFNAMGQWIDYLRTLTLLNWTLHPNAMPGGVAQAFGSDDSIGVVVAVDETGSIQYTEDGREFIVSVSVPAAARYDGVASDGAGLFVAVGELSGSTGRRIASSPDGDTWTARTPGTVGGAADFFNDVIWDPSTSLWVICGNGEIVETSPDGIAWTTEVTPGAADNLIRLATNGVSIMVAVGQNGRIISSPDGTTWTARTSGIAGLIQDVVWVPDVGVFVATSSIASGLIRSVDGISWTAGVNPTGWTLSPDRLACDGNRTVYACSPTFGLAFSEDGGLTWTLVEQIGSSSSSEGTPREIVDFALGRFYSSGLPSGGSPFAYTLRAG